MSARTAVRVISMATAHDRRRRFADDARSAGLDWSWFDGLSLPQGPLHHDEAATLVHTGRALRPGEIGCYASHHGLWCSFLQSPHAQLMVFEDDVVVDWAAMRLLCERDLARDGIHILKLYATHLPRWRVARYKLFSDHSHLLRLQGVCYGTQAYVLTRQGAAALVESCARLTMPVDWAMSRYWRHGLDHHAVFPFPVWERLGPSSIGHTAGGDASAIRSRSPSRLLWRLRERAHRAWADMRRSRWPFGPPSDAVSALFVTGGR